MKNILFSIIILYFFSACTSNPLGDDISNPKDTISGKIILDVQNQPEKIYVWLEGFEVGTFSDPTGNFSLSIPPGSNSDVDGVFNLFFYVANFTLKSVEVTIRNGEFIPDKGALGKNGILKQEIQLEQFLKISTEVSPQIVPVSYSGNLTIQSTFQTTNNDTATIIIPNSIQSLLGPVFFKNIDSERTYTFTGISLESDARIIVGNTPASKTISFPFNSLGLPSGSYKIIPFILINHQVIPKGLLHSIDKNIELLGNYFKIPISFTGGDLKIL